MSYLASSRSNICKDLHWCFTPKDKFDKFVTHLTGWFGSNHENKAAVWAKLSRMDNRNNLLGHFVFVAEYSEAQDFGLAIDPHAVCYHVMKEWATRQVGSK